MAPIYLDNHATTRVDPRVLDAMLPFLTEACGNPGSPHAYGEAAEVAAELARVRCAAVVDGEPRGVIFTSGATEANNLAILGTVPPRVDRRRTRSRLLVSAIEHKSVLQPAKAVADAHGVDLEVLPVDAWGHVDMATLARLLSDGRTIFVSIQLANNEVGTVQDIQSIGAACSRAGVPLHVDATQGVGRVPFSMRASGVSAVSLSGHKIYGPKGIGALVLARDVEVVPLQLGGGQEHGARAGTLNVPGIVGLGMACDIASRERPREAAHTAALRERFVARLDEQLPGCSVVGPFAVENDGRYAWPRRLPNNLSLMVPRVESKDLIAALKDRVCFSAGAACGCKLARSTDVLRALGLPDERGASVVRFGFGRFTTPDEVESAAREVARAAQALRRGRAAA